MGVIIESGLRKTHKFRGTRGYKEEIYAENVAGSIHPYMPAGCFLSQRPTERETLRSPNHHPLSKQSICLFLPVHGSDVRDQCKQTQHMTHTHTHALLYTGRKGPPPPTPYGLNV